MSVNEANQLAARWNTTARTIYRWHARGIDCADAQSVCDFLLSSKKATLAQLTAASLEMLALPAEADPFIEGLFQGLTK